MSKSKKFWSVVQLGVRRSCCCHWMSGRQPKQSMLDMKESSLWEQESIFEAIVFRRLFMENSFVST